MKITTPNYRAALAVGREQRRYLASVFVRPRHCTDQKRNGNNV
jgi:hypothetical protein